MLGDRWDANGQLAKSLWSLPVVMPDLPALTQLTSGFYDLTSGTWFAQSIFSGKNSQYSIVDRYKKSEFSPAAMAGQGVR
jgi:hypothetical protein